MRCEEPDGLLEDLQARLLWTRHAGGRVFQGTLQNGRLADGVKPSRLKLSETEEVVVLQNVESGGGCGGGWWRSLKRPSTAAA